MLVYKNANVLITATISFLTDNSACFMATVIVECISSKEILHEANSYLLHHSSENQC